MILKLRLSLLLCLITLLIVEGTNAQVVHDESLHGDFSGDNLNPTVLTLGLGSNHILGTTTSSPLDQDFFSFTLGPEQSLSAVILEIYDSMDDMSFIAVESGPQITDATSSDGLLGTALIGFLPGSQVGDDILDNLATADFGGAGFTPPLPSGTYTFWYQETFGTTSYGFDFQVVPEPSSLFPGVLAFVALCYCRRTANNDASHLSH